MLSVTELPKVDIKSLENIKFDQYSVKIDESETDNKNKRNKQKINQILQTQNLRQKLKKVT